MKPFEEIVSFIAEVAGSQKLSAFRPSKSSEQRISSLLAKQQDGTLSAKERQELELFVQLDHVMSLAKAKARSRSRVAAS